MAMFVPADLQVLHIWSKGILTISTKFRTTSSRGSLVTVLKIKPNENVHMEVMPLFHVMKCYYLQKVAYCPYFYHIRSCWAVLSFHKVMCPPQHNFQTKLHDHLSTSSKVEMGEDKHRSILKNLLSSIF